MTRTGQELESQLQEEKRKPREQPEEADHAGKALDLLSFSVPATLIYTSILSFNFNGIHLEKNV